MKKNSKLFQKKAAVFNIISSFTDFISSSRTKNEYSKNYNSLNNLNKYSNELTGGYSIVYTKDINQIKNIIKNDVKYRDLKCLIFNSN
jgi:hypothetical protein